jgi:hypothetical protein
MRGPTKVTNSYREAIRPRITDCCKVNIFQIIVDRPEQRHDYQMSDIGRL